MLLSSSVCAGFWFAEFHTLRVKLYHTVIGIAIGFSKKIKVFFTVPKKIPPICGKISPGRVRTRLKAVRISVTGRKPAQKIKTHIIIRRKT